MPGVTVSVVILVALFVSRSSDDHRRPVSAIGIAGMDRLVRSNVSPCPVGLSKQRGDVIRCCRQNGTITLGKSAGDRIQATARVTEQELADAAQLASLATKRLKAGRSSCREGEIMHRVADLAEIHAKLHPFTRRAG